MLEACWQDLRHGTRMLAKNPGFAAVAILSIAVGVGANAAMFSVAETLVLRPLPVPRANEIVRVMAADSRPGFKSPTASALSYPDYVDLRDRTRTFASLGAYRLIVAGFTAQKDQPAQRKFGMAASGSLFEAIGIRAGLGRALEPQDDRLGRPEPVVVLDYEAWRRDFGADPGVLGRQVRIGAVDMTVVGVMPSGFTGPNQLIRPNYYVPLTMVPSLGNGTPADELTRRDTRNLEVKGRLAPDATMAQAREEVRLLAAALEADHAATNRNQGLTVRTEFGGRVADRPALAVLAGMLTTLALTVLLVACANVAGLLTSRAPARARELAIRQAIGARPRHVLRQLVMEGVILGAAGGVLGLVFGYTVLSAFRQFELTSDVPLNMTFRLDRRGLALGMALAFASALLSSLLPAVKSSRVDILSGLRTSPGRDRGSKQWGRSVLVAGQVALSLVLLTVAVFLSRAYQEEIGRGPGFRTSGILMLTVYPDLVAYDQTRADAFYRRLADDARALPGVQAATVTSTVPMDPNSVENTLVAPDGFVALPGAQHVRVLSSRVDEGYFETLGVGIVSGRALRASDTATSPRVAVVNQAFADRYWAGQSAVGRRLRLNDTNATPIEIVGVAANAKYRALSEAPTGFIYYPRLQNGATNRGVSFEGTLLVATSGEPTAVAAKLREIVRTIDPGIPVFDVRTMASFYGTNAVGTSAILVRTVSALGVVGLALALVGLYGLVAYSVSRRTHEIGVRMAVGASPGLVLRLVLRQGWRLAASGTLLGLVASFGTSGLLRAAFPFPDVPGVEVASYALVIPVLLGVTLLAAYVPARRAAHIDPLAALRQE